MKLADAAILITGGARGIGFGCARACVHHGARVAIVDLDVGHVIEELSGFADVAAEDVLLLTADVRDLEQVRNAVQSAADRFGRLDGVINNAGWHPPAMTIDETSIEEFEAFVRLNLTSTFACCKYAAPYLCATRGAIVNMSSEVALLGQAAAPAYVATKAGQLGLTRALALDFAADGVRVNAVCPSGVLTPLMREWAGTQGDATAALRRVGG